MNDITIPGLGWDASSKKPLHEKLRADLRSAMLHKATTVKDAIRQVMAEFPKLTVPLTLESGKKTTRPKKPDEITDDDIISIIQGLVKSERATLELQQKASSDYLKILETYLPKGVEKPEIEAWIRENVNFSDFKNKMQAVGMVMKHFGKRADGNLVKEIVQAWPI